MRLLKIAGLSSSKVPASRRKQERLESRNASGGIAAVTAEHEQTMEERENWDAK